MYTLEQALEVVDSCMDVTQVEPEDNAAWLILRALLKPERPPTAWILERRNHPPTICHYNIVAEDQEKRGYKVTPYYGMVR